MEILENMNKKKTIVVNFYGGPGTGKSTICAGVFEELKWLGINCEMALEYAKDMVWEGSLNKFDNQLYIFAKQYHRTFRLLGKVDVILTDSPILMSLVYSKGKENLKLRELILDKYKELNNIDIFLRRKKKYNPKGRTQTFEGAKKLDKEILKVLKHSNAFSYFDAEKESINKITELIVRYGKLGKI